MKKIATLASAAALAAASMTVSAWWAAPYSPYGMTEDQQKAMQEQQQAMQEQHAKAMEQMMAAHRQMAEQMATQQAEMAKRMQEQGVGPMNMGFPGGMDPWGDMSMRELPTMPEMPAFGQMPEMPTMPEMPSFGQMPQMPTMPEMPAFGQMPQIPAMPEIPAFGQMPQMPAAHVPPHMQARYDAMQAKRAKAMEESKARRDAAIKEMTERRKEMEANRFVRPARYARPFASPYTMMAKAPEMPVPAPKAAPKVETSAPVVAAAPAAAVEAAPAPAVEAAPAVETAPAPAAAVAPVPAVEAAPVAATPKS